MQKFQNESQVEDSKRNLDYSTRYDDREFSTRNDKDELEWLSDKLNMEILEAKNNIHKMERLQERYHSDGIAAQAENRMGYYMRYTEAYERLKRMIESFYNQHHPVSDEGKQQWANSKKLSKKKRTSFRSLTLF